MSSDEITVAPQTPERVVLAALWEKVARDFAEQAPHHALLEHCRNNQLLSEAAAKYREHKDALPEGADTELLDKRLQAIALLAITQLHESRIEPQVSWLLRGVALFVGLLLVGSVVGLVRALLH